MDFIGEKRMVIDAIKKALERHYILSYHIIRNSLREKKRITVKMKYGYIKDLSFKEIKRDIPVITNSNFCKIKRIPYQSSKYEYYDILY